MCIEREGLLDMLDSLKNLDVQFVVVLSTNRLWCYDLVKVLLHRKLKKCNVDVRASDRPNYSIYTQNPNEIFVNCMFELLDIYERLKITLKLKHARMQRAVCRLVQLKQLMLQLTLQRLPDYMDSVFLIKNTFTKVITVMAGLTALEIMSGYSASVKGVV